MCYMVNKEEELRHTNDPKYSHLNEDLHVEITAFAPAPEAYIRMGNALHEVKRFLVPVSIQLIQLIVNKQRVHTNDDHISHMFAGLLRRHSTTATTRTGHLECGQEVEQ